MIESGTSCVVGVSGHLRRVAQYWDSVAARYLDLLRDELSGKPYDVWVL